MGVESTADRPARRSRTSRDVATTAAALGAEEEEAAASEADGAGAVVSGAAEAAIMSALCMFLVMDTTRPRETGLFRVDFHPAALWSLKSVESG